MPTPKENETKEEFIERCIPVVIDDGTAKDGSQANAVCNSIWTDEKEKKDKKESKGYVPYGVTTFAELDSYREAQERAMELYSELDDYANLVWEIAHNSEIEDKAAAFAALATEFSRRSTKEKEKEEDQPEVDMNKDKIMNWVTEKLDALKEVLNILEKSDSDLQVKNMMVFKDADGGYRWMTRYSNNIRDNDNPPEIISAKSHERFVELVDKGEVPYPELWLWHVKEWKIGVADFVAYDDSGFALASGYFLPGRDQVACWLKEQTDFLTSHGIPSPSIVRDPADPTIIVEHVTSEISPLPQGAAANKRGTNFVVHDKEVDMSIPKHKRQALEDMGLDTGVIDGLEALNAAEAAKAADEGVESKETTEEASGSDETQEEAPPEEEAKKEEETTEEATTEETTEESEAENFATREEVAEVIAAVVNPILEEISGLTDSVVSIAEDVKEMKRSDEEKIADQAKEIPKASLGEMVRQSIIGSPEARVDGRKELAKSHPKETKPEDNPSGEGFTGLKFVDDMILGRPVDDLIGEGS